MFNDETKKSFRQSLRNNMPSPEVILWSKLKGKQINRLKFRRQYGVGRYVLDFYCPERRLAIEIDGDSHYTDSAKSYDKTRENFLLNLNIKTLRFTNQDILNNLNSVLLEIARISLEG